MKVNSKDQVGAIIDRLKLLPHPEGGYYRETYKCDRQISVSDGRERTVGTLPWQHLVVFRKPN